MEPLSIQLVAPDERYEASFLAALDEFRREGLPWWQGEELSLAERDFRAFVALKLAEERRESGRIAKTHRWAIADERFVGRIGIFHELDDRLRREGGHIGYDTVPSARGRGVATAMLCQALPVARALGLTEVLITCDEDNAASIRVIENNGGELRETKVLASGHTPKRYYAIALTEP